MQTISIKLPKSVLDIRHQVLARDFSKSSPGHTRVFSGNTDDLAEHVSFLEKELQTSRDESYQIGYKEGKEAGVKEMSHKIGDLSEEFNAMIKSLKDQFDKALERMEKPLIQLSTRIAKKIIGTELANEEKISEYLSEKLKELLKDMKEQNHVKVRVNPDRMNWVSNEKFLQQLGLPKGSDILFVGDDSLDPGECIMETGDFIIDKTFENQLELMEQQMLGNRG